MQNYKKKIISFVGKLNSSKGYDAFGEAILKILRKYPNWKSIVIGDEPREKLNFKHKNLNHRLPTLSSHKHILYYEPAKEMASKQY
mgnify:CR=1 FL=1